MKFLRLDLGGVMRRDPEAKAFKIVGIIAGNPLIMKRMVEHVPDAGSYAPVTILVYESQGKVHLCYDSMASLLDALSKRSGVGSCQGTGRASNPTPDGCGCVGLT
jgi:hypothetical protein